MHPVARFDEIKQGYESNIMHTYKRFDIALESGSGAVAMDVNGKKYIDFGSGIGVNSLGYCDGAWADAVCAQVRTLSHTSNLYYTDVQARFARLLCSASGFSRVFFCNGGADANEGLIKLARKYSFDKYGIGRSDIVTLENSFHGRTITTLAATGQEQFHHYFFPFTEGFRTAKPNDFESLKAACGSDVCAVIMEAVQGEGGVCNLEPEFVKQAAAFCRDNDILLMFDEVQAGIARTGKLFAYENFQVEADAVSCAKGIAGGLPMGAVLCSEKLKDVLGEGTHGTTFGGNPIVCAGALEVINRVATPAFLNSVVEKGQYIRERLLHNPLISEVRGMGLMIGFEVNGISSGEIAVKSAENGLLVLTAKKSVRLLPPLTISKQEIDAGLEILESTIASF